MTAKIHIPVMVNEVLNALFDELDPRSFNNPKSYRILDATVGLGGHAQQILNKADQVLDQNTEINLFALDLDPNALEIARKNLENLKFDRSAPIQIVYLNGSFADLNKLDAKINIAPLDGALFDLGIGTHQLDDDTKGFAHRYNSPLDLRYDPNQSLTAENIINNWSKMQLTDLFRNIGEERRSTRIASLIVEYRQKKRITHTDQLTEIVKRACGNDHIEKSLSRIYMSLRVAVNQDLVAIESAMPAVWQLLRPGARVAVISYDSHQDRIIKNFFNSHAHPCVCPKLIPQCICGLKPDIKVLTKKVLRPSESEIAENRRARSAKLRAALKI